MLAKKLPRNLRGSLYIGNFYYNAGDYKAAERWYKKELEDLGQEDIGALRNLVAFYEMRQEYGKGLPYALLLEKILHKEKWYREWLRSRSENIALENLTKRMENIKAGKEKYKIRGLL